MLRGCFYYNFQEIDDSEFGAVYDLFRSCDDEKDVDENENLIKDFDRKINRDCCVLDFWRIDDPEIDRLLGEDIDKRDQTKRAYQYFKKKYL